MWNHYFSLCEGGAVVKEISIENKKLRFTFSLENGVKCTSVFQKDTGEEWMLQPCPLFVLQVGKNEYSGEQWRTTFADILEDSRDKVLVFQFWHPEIDLNIRFSLWRKEEEFVFLLQASANWTNTPKEVYLHIPLFDSFKNSGEWKLAGNPRSKPDGTPALELHQEFPLPICYINQTTGHGLMLELPDSPEVTGTWNQNRNRMLLQMENEEEFLHHRLLLRLQNKEFADVLELKISSLQNGYKEAFFRWKDHIREKMDLSIYQRKDIKWYEKALYHHLAFVYSREIFNYETQEFEVDRLLDEGGKFGGYDILVLWFVYPRLGVDTRKQWDFCRDIPGGYEGINKICEKAHKRGVKVMLPYNPWDQGQEESLADTLDALEELVKNTDIDGIWFDTMDSIPNGCRERLDNVRPGLVCCLEVTPRVKETVETITGSWNQRFAMPEGHILRYLFPEHKAPITSRWRLEGKKDTLIKRAIFNGTGFAVWQDVFGAWLPFDEKQKEDLKKWKQILLEQYDIYFGRNCMPLYPVKQKEIYVNAFYHNNGNEEIYSLYNASNHEVQGELIKIDPMPKKEDTIELQELWKNRVFTFSKESGIISGALEPEEIYIIKIKRREKL